MKSNELLVFKPGRHSKRKLFESMESDRLDTRKSVRAITFIVILFCTSGILNDILYYFHFIPLIGAAFRISW